MTSMLRAMAFAAVVLMSAVSASAQDAEHDPAALPAEQADAHHDDAHHDHAHHIGHPEGEVRVEAVDPDLAIYTFVVFLMLFGMLYAFAWKPIAAALDKREAGVRKNIEDAEQARKRAERMLDEHAAKLASVQDEVKAILAEARRDAEHTKQDIITEARGEAEASRHRAIVDIERARDAAMKELFDRMTDLVSEATAHVVGRSLGDGDHNRLIDEALADFQRDRALRN
ncbi:MAG: F0F1 ATP synthase subunit B [Planctomycetaceae bacterium]